MMTSAQVVETLVTTADNRTTLTQTIKLHYYMLPPDSNHLLNESILIIVISDSVVLL